MVKDLGAEIFSSSPPPHTHSPIIYAPKSLHAKAY
jgi:hypothetical protein